MNPKERERLVFLLDCLTKTPEKSVALIKISAEFTNHFDDSQDYRQKLTELQLAAKNLTTLQAVVQNMKKEI